MVIETLPQRVRVLLSLQRALVGEVFSALRMVSAEWTERTLTIFFYVDGELRDDDEGSVFSIAGEVAGDFEPDVAVNHHVVRCDMPTPIQDGRACVFGRREY